MTTLKNIKVGLWIVGSILIIVIGFCTVNVLTITKNPAFSIDFENKHQIIGGYASLIGAILSFLSIVFVLYNIVQQSHQYEEEKKAKEKKEIDSLFDRILLIDNVLNEITKHIINTGEEMSKFSSAERAKPLVSNFLDFYSSKQFYRLLELDYNSIYKAFQQFLVTDKEKYFNNLYSITDFYSEALPELKEIIKLHLSHKYNRRLDLVNDVKRILDLSSDIIKNIKETTPDNYENSELYAMCNSLILDYYELVRRNDKDNEETDFEELSASVFFPFIENYLKLDPHLKNTNAEIVANKISSVRKDIHSIRIEALDMANQIESRQKLYFIKSSKYIEKIEEIQSALKVAIRLKKISNLKQK